MATVILISCASKKLDRKSRAQEMYTSSLFRYSLKYAKSMNPDKIFILSAKYGLLHLEDIIEPYDASLNKMSTHEVKVWAENVLDRLKVVTNIQRDRFVFLSGLRYRKYLIPYLKNHEIPLDGLRIGEQLSSLRGHVS